MRSRAFFITISAMPQPYVAQALLFPLLLAAAAHAQSPPSYISSSTTLGLAGRVDYSKASNRLVFDNPNLASPGDNFAVYTSAANGSGRVCLTCAAAILPGQNGDPVWDPTGKYILFQAQDTSLPVTPPTSNPYKVTNPGYGENNNLWIMNVGATEFFQLTHVTAGMASLHPQWSHNGSLVIWAQKIGWANADGQWTIQVANVLWSGAVPSLTNIHSIAPLGTDTFYETSCFSADDSRILFTAGSPSKSQLNIYQYTLATGAIQNLTNPSNPTLTEWNELAKFTPDGRIVYSSSRNITIVRDYYIPYTDLWVMNGDGSNPTRLSYYNQPGYPEYYPDGLFVGDFAFGPSSQYIFSALEESLVPPPNSQMQYTLTSIQLTARL